jgi:hypothetical protein
MVFLDHQLAFHDGLLAFKIRPMTDLCMLGTRLTAAT